MDPRPPLLQSWLGRRTLWHTAGVLVALLVAMLLFQAYRQPDLLLELSNLQFC